MAQETVPTTNSHITTDLHDDASVSKTGTDLNTTVTKAKISKELLTESQRMADYNGNLNMTLQPTSKDTDHNSDATVNNLDADTYDPNTDWNTTENSSVSTASYLKQFDTTQVPGEHFEEDSAYPVMKSKPEHGSDHNKKFEISRASPMKSYYEQTTLAAWTSKYSHASKPHEHTLEQLLNTTTTQSLQRNSDAIYTEVF